MTIELNEGVLTKIDLLFESLEVLEEKNILVGGRPQTPNEKHNRVISGRIHSRSRKAIGSGETSKSRSLGGTEYSTHRNLQRDILSGKRPPGFFIGQRN